MRRSARLAVDVRMLAASGIGTYLANMLPGIADHLQEPMLLLGNDADRSLFERSFAQEWIPFPARPFSLREQITFPLLPLEDCTLWIPTICAPFLPIRARHVVSTIHDAVHLALPHVYPGFLKQCLYRRYYQRTADMSELVLTDSQFSRQELIRFLRVPAEKIHAIHIGFNPQAHTKRRPRPGASPEQRPYLLLVGNMKPHKNIPRTIRAFARVMDQIPHDLVVVGKADGFLSGDPSATALINHHPDRVRFTGFVEKATLAELYEGAHALLFPSLYEGFGLPPLEAMSCGVPVAAARTASIPEVCGDAVLYFDPLDTASIAHSIVEITRDAGLRARLRARGKKRIALYSWKAASDATWALLEPLTE